MTVSLFIGIKFFAKRSLSLLNSMFNMEDDYILASFLHPNFKGLLSATAAQKAECYRTCRASLPAVAATTTTLYSETEPPKKKQKKFLEQLMDDEMSQTKTIATSIPPKGEPDLYIEFKVDKDKNYINPLTFWKENAAIFPNLSKLACRIYSIPCSSSAVEREFSAAGQIVNQRRSNLDPTTVNNILFLRSIEHNHTKC